MDPMYEYEAEVASLDEAVRHFLNRFHMSSCVGHVMMAMLDLRPGTLTGLGAAGAPRERRSGSTNPSMVPRDVSCGKPPTIRQGLPDREDGILSRGPIACPRVQLRCWPPRS